MQNTIQTFDRFNGGRRRPDRRGHLKGCGFEYKGSWLIEPPFTPRDQAARIAESYNAAKGKLCHVVYWQGERNMDGWRGYQYWIKGL